jgi:hypothetical protein
MTQKDNENLVTVTISDTSHYGEDSKPDTLITPSEKQAEQPFL